MVQAIGAAQASGFVRPTNSSAGQAAELAKLEKELSACVNCATAKTREGQAKIEAVSQRINQVRTQISQSEQVKFERRTLNTTTAETPTSDVVKGSPEPAVEIYSQISASPFAQGSSRIGTGIDTLA